MPSYYTCLLPLKPSHILQLSRSQAVYALRGADASSELQTLELLSRMLGALPPGESLPPILPCLSSLPFRPLSGRMPQQPGGEALQPIPRPFRLPLARPAALAAMEMPETAGEMNFETAGALPGPDGPLQTDDFQVQVQGFITRFQLNPDQVEP